MTEDFYDLLDVPPDASQEEIKEAYREQVRVYHPDLNDDDRAQAQFTAVKTAYDILGDSVERQAYDRLGHEEYVAKRTSGLPSPDVWQSDDESTTESDETTAATATAGGRGTTSTSRTRSRSSSRAGASASQASSAAGAGATTSGSSTAGHDAGGRGTTSSTDGGTGHGTARSGTTGARTESASTTGFSDNAVVRWWRRQNFSLPLIWLSVLVYLGGLAHFALDNESGLESLWTELTAVGTDLAGVWEVLSSERYGIDSSVEYLAAVEFVTPPLSGQLWYGTLAAVVGLTLLALLAVRVVRDRETWGPTSIDEVIVLALALTATTGAAGGPLLAGAVLMPVLFGLIVRHTRRGPGWKPSYLYVLPVLAPAGGFALAAAGETTLAIDLVAFVILPIVGALGLPLRATIRKRFGR